jgi:WD40 repeat protein
MNEDKPADPNSVSYANTTGYSNDSGDQALMMAMNQLNTLATSTGGMIPNAYVDPGLVGSMNASNVFTLANSVKEESSPSLKRKRDDLSINTERVDDLDPDFDEEEEKPARKKKTTTPRVKKKPAKKATTPTATTTPKPTRKKITTKFKYTGSIVQPDTVTAVIYNQNHSDYLDTLAVVGGHYVTIYKTVEVSKAHPAGLRLMKTFYDENEEMTTAAWGVDQNGDPIIAVGTKSGNIKAWNFSWRSVKKDRFRMMKLSGHGGPVNEICFHPIKRELLVSGSDDHSIRLWDLTLGRTVAVFADTFPVLSVDFHITGSSLVSSSASGIKIWATDDDSRALEYLNYLRSKQRAEYRSKRKNTGKGKAIIKDEASTPGGRRGSRRISNVARTDFYYFYSSDDEMQQSVPKVEPDITSIQTITTIVEPSFSTNKVHGGIVDCVRYYGDLILSRAPKKDAEPGNRIVLWAPNSVIYSNENIEVDREKEVSEHDREFTTVHVFLTSQETDLADVKMTLDASMTQLAVPIENGKVDVFDLQKLEEERVETVTPRKRSRAANAQASIKRVSEPVQSLEDKDVTGNVRTVSLSYDQKSIVYGGDDKTIWKYDR